MNNGIPSQFQFSGDVAILGGNFQHQTSISTTELGFERLQKRVAAAAMHDSGESFEKPKCHENTRIAVLARLMDWILGNLDQDKLVMWLYGDAGAGKSAIAQTLALRCSSAGYLLASFAFSRNDTTRATHTPLAPTIAYQVGTIVPELRSLIAAAIERDPMLFEKSLEVQFTSLIVKPINDLNGRPGFPGSIPHLIIIDGLDECSDTRIQIRVLEVISDAVQQCNAHLRVLIASRPQVDIKSTFDYDPLESLSTRLALDASFKPSDDIRLVFEEAFRDIKAKHRCKRTIPSPWPDDKTLQQLVSRASGQFIYMSAVVNYVSSSRHHPVERLKIVLGIQPRDSDQDLPFSRLDELYTHIFHAIPEENIQAVLDILAFKLYGFKDLSLSGMHPVFPLLSLDDNNLELYLGDLSAVLKWTASPSGRLEELYFTHASLSDFLSDRGRSGEFYIDKGAFRSKLACICLNHFRRGKKIAEVTWYALENLPYLCQTGRFTPELRENLSSFRIFNNTSLWPTPNIISYMNMLRNKKNTRDIYSNLLSGFDQYLFSWLKTFRPNQGRILQIATLGLRTNGLHNDSKKAYWLNSVFGHYTFGKSIKANETGPLLDFFEDPTRSKEFSRTGSMYAIAALAGFNEILSESPPTIISHRNYRIAGPSWEDPNNKDPELAIQFFLTACCYLYQLLDRSSHSPELIAFIQSGNFQSTYGSIVFRDEHLRWSRGLEKELIPKVLHACESYLKRVEPSVSSIEI